MRVLRRRIEDGFGEEVAEGAGFVAEDGAEAGGVAEELVVVVPGHHADELGGCLAGLRRGGLAGADGAVEDFGT